MTARGAVVAADTHLRRFRWSSRPELQGDAFYALQQLTEHCAANRLNLVLAGDIFDVATPDSESVMVFEQAIAALDAAGLRVFVIQGQHDYAVPAWPRAIGSRNVQHVHEQTFHPIDGGPAFYAFDHCRTQEAAQAAVAKIPADAVAVVVHQLARSVFPLEGKWNFDTEWLPANITHTFLGDYHDPVDFPYDGGHAWYTGSTYMYKTDEAHQYSFIEIDAALNVKRVPLKARPVGRVTVNTPEDLASLLEQAAKQPEVPQDRRLSVDMPLLLVAYKTEVPEVAKQLTAAYAGKSHVWLKPYVLRQTSGTSNTPAVEEEPDVGMLDCLPRVLKPGTDAYEFTSQLLTRSVTEVTEEWRKKLQIEAVAHS